MTVQYWLVNVQKSGDQEVAFCRTRIKCRGDKGGWMTRVIYILVQKGFVKLRARAFGELHWSCGLQNLSAHVYLYNPARIQYTVSTM